MSWKNFLVQGVMDILDLHPSTIKSLRSGHPWITKDKFTKHFPNKTMLKIKDAKSDHNLGHFIHDPEHPRIKARFWGEEVILFQKELQKRLWQTLEKRQDLLSERENLYLVFGEVDNLPGLYVQLFGENLLIGYQAFFWKEHINFFSYNFFSGITKQFFCCRVICFYFFIVVNS
jgi:23S rRNA (cytosine1962-C5)-methyltransferase